MTNKIIWKTDSEDPNNADNLELIGQWWSKLNNCEIIMAQRLIPESGNLDAIDWEPQRFDEKLVFNQPQLRGITLYWQKLGEEDERNITARKLELDRALQQLYIYPQAQPQIVICVTKPGIAYQTIELRDPLIVGTVKEDSCILLLRDKQQQMQVKLILSTESLQQLRESLPE